LTSLMALAIVGGASGLCIPPALAAGPAVVDSEGASAVLAATARLEAQVNPENQPTTSCVFRYEAAKASATSIPCEQGPLEGESDTLASADLSGLQPDETYSYRIVVEDGSGPTEGPLQTFTTIGLPKVSDQAPSVSSITRTSALVFATVNPERDPQTTYHVVYVDSAGYEAQATNPYGNGASTPNLPVGEGSSDVPVGPQPVTGLNAGTTYHYALVATNAAGAVRGPDYTFTTATPTPPVVVTGGPSDIAQTSATISGTVDPESLQTSYEFEVGLDTAYAGAKIFGNAGDDAGVETVTVNLGELIPGITYHYRMVATNEDGTSYGADQSFTIPPVPSLIVQVPPTPLIALPKIAFPAKVGSTTTTKSLTSAQKLVRALKACSKKPKKQRAGCVRQAGNRYGAKARKRK
jgi:phosphodiesterase/alkaline phosphatase D-like protein